MGLALPRPHPLSHARRLQITNAPCRRCASVVLGTVRPPTRGTAHLGRRSLSPSGRPRSRRSPWRRLDRPSIHPARDRIATKAIARSQPARTSAKGDAPMAGPDPVGACTYRPRCPSRPRAAVVEAHRLRRGSDGPFNRSRSPWAAHLGGPHDRLDEETNPHASKEGRYPVSQPPRWRPPRQDRQSSSRAVFVVSRSNRRDLLVTADADLGAAFRHDLFESVKPS